jgi:glycosyltransferase involved in cell wall biosynthesis
MAQHARPQSRAGEPGALIPAAEFTVIIPTFNRAPLLERAISSVLAQTVAPAEILVIDDGSTDDTASLCAKYGETITYVRQPNGGVAAARNTGIRRASSPWIAFLDSDDYWTAHHLERIAGAIRATGGMARFYFSDMALPSQGAGDTTLWKYVGFAPVPPWQFVPCGTAWMLLKRQPVQAQCGVFSAAALRAVGGFDPRYRVSEDVELFCRLGIEAPVCAVSGVGCVQTSDDAIHNRLSNLAEAHSEVFWRCNTMLWRSVLRNFPALAPGYRRLVRSNLADAYLRLAKALWREHNVPGTARALLRGLASCEVSLLVWLLRHRSFRGWDERVRPTPEVVEG